MAIAGGGSGVLSGLLSQPGASRTMLEAVVPYCQSAMEDWLGGPVDQACSEPTARAMAMAAWTRACRLTPDGDPHWLVGLGGTASLATDRPKRGPHRIHVATQTATITRSISLELQKGQRDRRQEERLATALILIALAEACEVETAGAQGDLDDLLLEGERLNRCEQRAPAEWTELLLGQRQCVFVAPALSDASGGMHARAMPAVVLPGAFNPPHAGHCQMARVAQQHFGKPVAWELSIRNVDKGTLDFFEVARRVEAVQKIDGESAIVLTAAATFREKAGLFPGCHFVVGVDTIARIADSRYYGGNRSQHKAAIDELAGLGCRFLVFGRQLAGRFQTLGDLQFPDQLQALCDEMPAEEFRADISSTELRAARDAGN